MLRDWEACDAALRQIAEIDITVAGHAATRDTALLAAEEGYKQASTPLVVKREKLAEDLESFYRANRREVEAGNVRSKELHFGRLGMRKGKPTLKLAKGWKWEKVLAAVKDRWKKDAEFLKSLVTTKESLNKDGVKACLDEDAMAAVGLRVKQDDEFFFETFPEKVQNGRGV